MSVDDDVLARPRLYPLLLPWAAEHADPADLGRIATAAQRCADPGPDVGWPVVADATAEVLARRIAAEPAMSVLVDELLGALPVLGGALARSAPDPPTSDDPDVAGYVALATGRPASGSVPGAGSPYWSIVLTGRADVPLLAHLPSLAQLLRGVPHTVSPATAIYLLPYIDEVDDSWEELVGMAMQVRADDAPAWRVSGLGARAAWYLPEDLRRVALDILGDRHPDVARRLATLPVTPPLTLEDELTRAHPYGEALLRDPGSPVQAARLCRMLVDGLVLDLPDTPARTPTVRDASPPVRGWTGRLEAADTPSRPTRHVTVFVAVPGSAEPITDRPLAARVDHEVVVRIGRPDLRSLLAATPDASFPDEYLPDEDVELEVALVVAGKVRTEQLTLPRRRDSDERRLLLSGLDEGRHTAHLGLYYRTALVFAAELVLPVGPGDDGPTAVVRYRLSRSLADLWWLADRSASIAVFPGTSAVLVNGLSGGVRAGRVEPTKMDEAARWVRSTLRKAHLKDDTHSWYDASHAKASQPFLRDLAELAWLGQKLYGAVADDRPVRAGLPYRLRDEAAAGGRPPIIQVVGSEWQGRPVPWAAVYDLPLGGDTSRYEVCPSLAPDRLATLADDPPARCPFDDRHRQADGTWLDNQLCPWGFWGFSAVLEHPPTVSRRDLERVVGSGTTLRYLIADGQDLDDRLRRRHVARLTEDLGPGGTHLENPDGQVLKEALSTELDIVYLYCHCGWSAPGPIRAADPYLQFKDRVDPGQIEAWILTSRFGPWWTRRHPLVVINGCHTVEQVSGSLGDFVSSFVDWAQAAGVVGTEIKIDQALAGWAMELFLDAVRTSSVGDAIRTMRWQMLRRGNVMGLAYTPYCLADLRLRERTTA